MKTWVGPPPGLGKAGCSRVGWGGKGRDYSTCTETPAVRDTLDSPRKVLVWAGPCTSSLGGGSLSWGGVLSYGPGNAGCAKGGETEALGPQGGGRGFT